MVQIGWRKPENGVATGEYVVELLRVGANATAAKMLPGIAVVYDSNDRSVKEAGVNGDIIGFLGYEDTPIAFKPATRDTAYAVGDTVAVIHGPGGLVRTRLAISQTVVKGERMSIAADGYTTIATIGTHDVVGDAEESVTTGGDATGILWISMRR
jgi:hypothetical protein